VSLERGGCLEKVDTKALARAVVLGDEGARHLSRRIDQMGAADGRKGARRPDAVSRESRILRDLAYLELQCAAVIDDAPPMRFQPGEDTGRVFGRIAMAAGVRRSAHPVVEHTGRRHRRKVQQAFAQEPFLERKAELGERRPQRLDPGVVFVDDVDFGHCFHCRSADNATASGQAIIVRRGRRGVKEPSGTCL
jgi:hypothetical protein